MSISRTVAVLTAVTVTLMLAEHMIGHTAPVPKMDSKMKASFEGLQKKLPTLVAHWLNEETHGLVELKEVKTEIKLARYTGSSDAKITLFLSLTEMNKLGVPSIPYRLSLYLHYFDGQWTTTRVDCASKWTEEMISLMLAIDRASEK